MSMNAVRIIDVAAEDIDQIGFFSLMSKRNSEDYRRKRAFHFSR